MSDESRAERAMRAFRAIDDPAQQRLDAARKREERAAGCKTTLDRIWHTLSGVSKAESKYWAEWRRAEDVRQTILKEAPNE